MATLYIAEYSDLAKAAPYLVQVPMEAPLTEQTVAIGGSSVQSAAFNTSTRLVRIHTNAICSIKFGTNPTASVTTARMAAGQTEYHGVPIGGTFKVAVITNT